MRRPIGGRQTGLQREEPWIHLSSWCCVLKRKSAMDTPYNAIVPEMDLTR